jgi:hypothetical protein
VTSPVPAEESCGEGESCVVATLPACAALAEASCVADPRCEPGYWGVCDCTCPGPPGYEGKGCGNCSESCFEFAACVAKAQRCLDPNDPKVHYLFDDPLVCAAAKFGCGDPQTRFFDDCGCGCIDP